MNSVYIVSHALSSIPMMGPALVILIASFPFYMIFRRFLKQDYRDMIAGCLLGNALGWGYLLTHDVPAVEPVTTAVSFSIMGSMNLFLFSILESMLSNK
jgi:hypothetical protein